ncbi:MAG: phosphatidate cytidylyltransferase [Thermodesulfobacteriota bacterium]
MHKKRWITGLSALPFLVGLISWGGTTLFAWVVALVSLVGIWESFRILFPRKMGPDKDPVPVSGNPDICFQGLSVVSGLVILSASFFNAFHLMVSILALNLMTAAFISMLWFRHGAGILHQVYRQILVVLYVPFFLSHLILIRNGMDGILWIYLLLCLVFAGDIGAFYMGTYAGKHKLCPSISPGKTIEGAVGGLISTLGIGALFKFLFLPGLPWAGSILLFIAAGIAGQAGDLFESELKRASGIKDSGGIFPGHGGLLDRIDALLFAAPVAYMVKEYVL